MRGNNILGILFANIHDTRVGEVTHGRAMASVPFGGRYRMIDFVLSNMVNSGINKVGVITKSNYQSLMNHLGSGKAWDLSKKREGLFILPPFGTGDFVYNSRVESLASNLPFLKHSNEEYVILSNCDVVCNIDYAQVAAFHAEKNADITVIYKNGQIPQKVENLAVYKFDAQQRATDLLVDPDGVCECNYGMDMFFMRRELLISIISECISRNTYSFLRHIIQKNLKNYRIFGYEFKGFENIICSFDAYFKANMDLMQIAVREELFDPQRPIYTKVHDDMPTRYGLSSSVANSIIADGCIIDGEIENCVLFRGVKVGKGTKLKNCVIMQGTEVGENCHIDYTVTDKNVKICANRSLMGFYSYPIFIGKGSVV